MRMLLRTEDNAAMRIKYSKRVKQLEILEEEVYLDETDTEEDQ